MNNLNGIWSELFFILLQLIFLKNSCAIQIDCKNPPPLVDPQTCCTDGGRDEASEICAGKFGITSLASQPPMNIDTAACLAECVLTESKYLVSGNLNFANIQSDLQLKFPQDPAYVDAMTRSYQKCGPIALKKMEELRQSPQGGLVLGRKCSPLSGIILGCTYTEYFHNCPAVRWNPTEQCELAKQYLKTCTVF